MRISFLNRKALEEAFIDGVQELLSFAPTFNALGCQLNRYIETVQNLQKFIAIELTNGQGINDFLNFCRYDIAADKIGIIEDGTEEALGEQVLDKHLVDSGIIHLWINRGAAEFGEITEGNFEFLVEFMFIFDDVEHGLCMLWDALFELINRLLEVLDIWFNMGEEL